MCKGLVTYRKDGRMENIKYIYNKNKVFTAPDFVISVRVPSVKTKRQKQNRKEREFGFRVEADPKSVHFVRLTEGGENINGHNNERCG